MKKAMGGVVPETESGWISLLEQGGFREISSLRYDMKIFSQWINEVRGMEAIDYFKFTLLNHIKNMLNKFKILFNNLLFSYRD